MIDRALPTQPISKFRQAGQEILDELDRGPVLLTQHGVAAGVLLSVDLYNSMVSYIRSFDDVELIRRRLLEMDVDERTYLSLEQLDQAMKQRGLVDAK
ncbi:MAG: type II toxin-antitoxin system Phd/YefM family antitoxin [Caldilineaceae bacterium]